MTALTNDILETVAGGSRRSEQLDTTLTQIQSSIKDLASSQNTGSSNTTTMLMLAMAMQNRQPTVVAAQPVFSFRARIRL